ncbi:MAG: hypothetical protein AB1439_08670 [candidate division FCPU426 bacterium]
MERWDIDKQGLTYGTGEIIKEKNWIKIPDKIFESPAGKYAVYLYGSFDAGRDGPYLANFMILKNAYSPSDILKSAGSEFHAFRDTNENASVNWSEDEHFVAITVVPHMRKYYGHEGKLIVDLQKNRFTYLSLAGAYAHEVEFNSREMAAIKHSSDGGYGYNDYLIMNTEFFTLNQLPWLSLADLRKITVLHETGFYGHLVGRKNKRFNVYFNKSYIPWPYNKMGVEVTREKGWKAEPSQLKWVGRKKIKTRKKNENIR